MMIDFSVVDSLIKLKDKNYDININRTIDMLINRYDEENIRILLKYQGIKLDNKNIILFFIDNVGFRCYNEKSNIYGKFPICNNIEHFLNSLYLDAINSLS